MKKARYLGVISFLVACFVQLSLAQVPLGFKYQAVARNGDELMRNQNIAVTIKILQDGEVVYSETHNTQTNEYGLFSLSVGSGNALSGDFGAINWEEGNLSLKPEVNGITTFPESPILAVPYALYAEIARDDGDWEKNGENIFYLNENVGVGTSAPGAKLHIKNDGGALRLEGQSHTFIEFYPDGPSTRKAYLGFPCETCNNFDIRNEILGAPITINGADGSGPVGIGTNNPGAKLHIRNDGGALRLEGQNHTFIEFYPDGPDVRKGYIGYPCSTCNELTLRNEIPDAPIFLDGHTKTKVLEITGGSDLSESSNVISKTPGLQPEPGMLVSIDPENSERLMITQEARDKKVAGVISGANGINPGMVMRQEGTLADGKYPIALVGRVHVKADASFGAIEPGDMLTSSPVPGYAMKVRDFERAQGAIIGKAMSGLDEGQGFVWVLVNLQ